MNKTLKQPKRLIMEKEFIPYEQALELKKLGFDEPCFAWYAENKKLQISPDVYKKWTSKPCNNSNIIIVFNSDCVTVPTFSQAFRWFREKYNLYSFVQPLLNDDELKQYVYWYVKLDKIMRYSKDEYISHEEAELACLNKLIEILKQPKKD
jgi:hypothetical protein